MVNWKIKSSLYHLAKCLLACALLSEWKVLDFLLALPEISACQYMMQDPFPKFFPHVWSFQNLVVFPRKASDTCHLKSGVCPIFKEVKTRRIKVTYYLIYQGQLDYYS